MSKDYSETRKEIEEFFKADDLTSEFVEETLSPSGRYTLSVFEYTTSKFSWSCSRGIVKSKLDGEVIADIKRNYSQFWFTWSLHSNQNEYLLCGEDYQGQTVVNLNEKSIVNYFPEEGYDGLGFCWVAVYPSPDNRFLAVEGCYWGCPYELVFFDFSSPDTLPFKELARVDSLYESLGWVSNNSFKLTKEVEMESSDDISSQTQPKNEQKSLNDPTFPVKTNIIQVIFNVPDVGI